MAQNPVTGLKEPYFPPHTRLPRLLTSSAAILIMLCVLMIFLVSVIIYCGIISIAMFHTANSVLMTQHAGSSPTRDRTHVLCTGSAEP
nr:anoctamin-7-like [Globicephala melas]